MPRIFSERERNAIMAELRKAASGSLARSGVRKTTVEELTKEAGIAKGSFYLFYDTKEDLFLDVLSSFTMSLEEMYLEMLQNLDENHIVTSLTNVFIAVAIRFRDEGIFRFLDKDNLSLISRRANSALFADVMEMWRKMFHSLFQYFYIENDEDIRAFEKSYSAVLNLFLSPLGESLSEDTLSFIIRGLVLQMVE